MCEYFYFRWSSRKFWFWEFSYRRRGRSGGYGGCGGDGVRGTCPSRRPHHQCHPTLTRDTRRTSAAPSEDPSGCASYETAGLQPTGWKIIDLFEQKYSLLNNLLIFFLLISGWTITTIFTFEHIMSFFEQGRCNGRNEWRRMRFSCDTNPFTYIGPWLQSQQEGQ